MTVEEVVGQLQRTALFADAATTQLAALATRAFRRRFAAGQIVFVEGEPSEHLYVVLRGRVRILVQSSHGDEMTLSVLGPGDVLGELSVIDRHARSATAEAVDDCELLALSSADVRATLCGDPALLLATAAELAGTVRRLTGATADLVFLDLPRRLAKLLITEASGGPAGVPRAQLGMSQSGLAARLGVTRQSLNRALNGLIRRGWVQQDGSGYVLRDPAALRRFAGG